MNSRSFYARYGKRWLDCVTAASSLAALALPMAVIAALVLLTSGRPILFRQTRIGRFGRPFRIAKFRTMANRRTAGTTVTAAGDARITRLGRVLRRLKLDELPQLLNVLRGEMSFVGPRPDVPGYMDRLEGDDARLLELRPGITGPASLAFRHEEELLAQVDDPVTYNDEVIFPEKVRLNLEYLDSVSFWEDLRCLVQTIMPLEAGAPTFHAAVRPTRYAQANPSRHSATHRLPAREPLTPARSAAHPPRDLHPA